MMSHSLRIPDRNLSRSNDVHLDMKCLAATLTIGISMLAIGCSHHPKAKTLNPTHKSASKPNPVPVIHIIVALCDNKYQGIIPVPAKIGNGDDPEENLYWGCDLGIKTYFRRSADWKLAQIIRNPSPVILERLIFTHRKTNAVMVADAYRGREIKRGTEDFLAFAGGNSPSTLVRNKQNLSIGGGADFLIYVGHDGLMNFGVNPSRPSAQSHPKKVAILCCKSQEFFGKAIKSVNAVPVLWTKSLMAPEAYVAEAAIQSYLKKDSANQATERAAKAYGKYQKCSLRAARTVFTSGF